jgi:hypothetical protein
MDDRDRHKDQRVKQDNDKPLGRRNCRLAEHDLMPSRFEYLLDRDDGALLGDLLTRCCRHERQQRLDRIGETGRYPPQARATLCHCRPVVCL